jgi:hypothetical protein
MEQNDRLFLKRQDRQQIKCYNVDNKRAKT